MDRAGVGLFSCLLACVCVWGGMCGVSGRHYFMYSPCIYLLNPQIILSVGIITIIMSILQVRKLRLRVGQ